MATGLDTSHTPWAQIGNDPSKFFDEACIPDGFKFQDPSRMGLSVKVILDHLRKRQDELGVNAFHFHHILSNQKLEDAAYPPQALRVIKSGNGKDWPAESNTSEGQGNEEETDHPVKRRKISKKKPDTRLAGAPENAEAAIMAASDMSDIQTDNTDQAGGAIMAASDMSEVQTDHTDKAGVGILTKTVQECSTDMIDMEAVSLPSNLFEAVSEGNTIQPVTQDVIVSSQLDSSPPVFLEGDKTDDPFAERKQHSLGHQWGRPPNAFIFPPETSYPGGHTLHHPDVKPTNALIFPSDAAYAGQTSNHPHMSPHGMPLLSGPPAQPWPSKPMYAPTEMNSALYPYQMGPMMAVYHPHYGYQQFPVDPQLNQARPQQTPANVGLHLQVPTGEPVFSTPPRNVHQESDMLLNSSFPVSSVMARPSAATVLIKPPTYTPNKSAVKKSPLKRPRGDDTSAQTPTRRSGRKPKTPKNLLQ